MITPLPSRVMDYTVTSSSPTGELLTLGQILSEVGDYASTILDRDHISFSRRCGTKLSKVVGELISRQCIRSAENLYEIRGESFSDGSDCSDHYGCPENLKLPEFSELTISQLHNLYRRWPIRHKLRMETGREHLSFFQEGRIVDELRRRKPADKGEQLKIDYCMATYRNELENLSFILSLPIHADGNKIFPDSTKTNSPDELAAMIRRLSDFRDVTEREILVEYADRALDLLQHDENSPSNPGLLSALADLGLRKTIRIPAWVNGMPGTSSPSVNIIPK